MPGFTRRELAKCGHYRLGVFEPRAYGNGWGIGSHDHSNGCTKVGVDDTAVLQSSRNSRQKQWRFRDYILPYTKWGLMGKRSKRIVSLRGLVGVNNRSLAHWLCWSGCLGLLSYVAHIQIGTAAYPGYDWQLQAVSDLTAAGSPSFTAAIGFASAANALQGLCAAVMAILIPRTAPKMLRWGVYLFAAMTWLSTIGYALFPLSESGMAGAFQDIIHVYVVTPLVVLSSVTALVAIGLGARKDFQTYHNLSWWAWGALFVMLAGPFGMIAAGPEWFGLFERFSVLSVVFFNAILVVHGFFLWKK